jgi:hypothetical protein
MQAQGSQQVSLRAPRLVPGSAGSVRGFAGVAQLVEHLFCKQVVSGSIPLASSGGSAAGAPQFTRLVKASEGCPSGQREQAVNLPAHAYVGSNPTPSTSVITARTARGSRRGMTRPRQGFDLAVNFAGVTQLVESQFSKLKVDGSSPFSRSNLNVTTSNAHLAQMVEHVLGKDEVTSSILVVGSNSVQPQ